MRPQIKIVIGAFTLGVAMLLAVGISHAQRRAGNAEDARAAARAARSRADLRAAQESRARDQARTAALLAAQSRPQPKSSAKPAGKPAVPDGRQVSVEFLFIEFESTDADKDAPAPLIGDIKDVEKRLRDLKTARELKTLQRIQLSTFDRQLSTTHIGNTAVQVTSSNRFGGGRAGGVSRSYSNRSLGTIVTLTPRIESTGAVVLEVNFEKSSLKGAADKPSEPGESVVPQGTATITLKSTLRVQPGKYARVAGSSNESNGTLQKTVILVTVRLGETFVKPRDIPRPGKLQIYHLKHVSAKDAVETLEQLFSDQPVRFVAVAHINTVIAKGKTEALKTVEALLQVLDTKSEK